MSQPVLELFGIGKSYRTYANQWHRFRGWLGGEPSGYEDKWVLRDLSFAVRAGESVGILGRNGAGKSTLLKIILGTIFPTEGRVSTNGRVSALLELGSGLNPELSARENVLYACGLQGRTRSEVEEAMPRIEQFADIGPYFNQPLRTLSTGMQMRIAFAAATEFRPDILIIDEALSVGDLSFQAKCFERINSLKSSGTTLLLVSHAVADMVKHCERAILLNEGYLKMDGSSREVSNAYLDELFGKQRGQAEQGEGLEVESVSVFSTGVEDCFHNRPYYRRDEYRWGLGGAKIVDFCLEEGACAFPTVFTTHKKLRISFKVYFERDVEYPVYGVLVKTHDGVFVYGTNSRLAKSESYAGRVEAGGVRVVSFEFPIMLNAGAYLLSLGISEEPETGTDLAPLDRRYDSILVTVTNDAAGWGFVDLGARFEVAGSR